MEIVTRKEAKALGLKRYFTGKPCARGHVSERRTWCGWCMGCESHFGELNREKKAKYDKARVSRLAETISEKNRERYQKRREAVISGVKAWQEINLDRVRHYKRKNKANRRAATSFCGELDELVMLEAFDLAKRRERVTGFAWHADHMIPLRARNACGLHCAYNIQVIPARLNLWKLNKMQLTEPGEWIRYA